ncbi:hypothetical protein L227DRAFT_183523 [Lentinus tigrinus ALCF2SS1-6]|uniref:Uncharacterized protein n=1 Tax=Lentinus tigrinus ALCF2SS1-6 TaxID=1328759 RepID=A0A5C2S6D5_9APHY|nr:hypothetical protein L227DRAFT_183523 [Lentinus tigrinus ALCF2SS1-6]
MDDALGLGNVVRSARKRQAPVLVVFLLLLIVFLLLLVALLVLFVFMSSTPARERKSSTPKWRSSLSTPKRQKPATAVSIVFAQPEQGARLGSAIDKLPAVAVDDAASFMSESSRKRERLNSNASSYISRVEPRSDIPQREPGDVTRKRSKLTMDVEESPSETDAGNGQFLLDVQDLL